MDQGGIAGFVERTVDGEASFAPASFLVRLYVRKWTFLLCLLIPTAIGLAVTLATPMTWVATSKFLIRYSPSESVFLQDLIPDNRVALSGAVITEILRSLPTLAETIQRYHIQESDLYRDPTRVVFGKLASLLPLPAAAPPPPGLPGLDPKITAMATTFQDSLEENSRASPSALGARARPVELLGKDATVPQAEEGDELVTVTVRSFNREKVAEMTNGLVQTFIEQYYQISAEDAHRSYVFLSGLSDSAAADVRALEQNPDAPVTIAGSSGITAGNSPAITRLTEELVGLEAGLDRSQQFYKDDSTRIQHSQAEIADLKRQLAGQERLDVAKQVLAQIQARRFQALNTEKLYRSRLVPISVVEPAVTPAPSTAASIMRVVTSLISGLLIGTVLGLTVVIVFSLLDQRVFIPADVERGLGLPVFGWLPRLRGLRGRLPKADGGISREAMNGLLQVLARLEAVGSGRSGRLVAIASTDDDDGKSLTALLIARTLASATDTRVLLIDADPLRASLSRQFNQAAAAGLIEAAATARPLAELAIATGVPGLDLLAAGAPEARQKMSFGLQRLRAILDEARRNYDLVIIDTAALTASGEALLCCMAADTVLVVVRAGATRRNQAKAMLRKLGEVAVRPQGAILNRRWAIVPRFLDRAA